MLGQRLRLIVVRRIPSPRAVRQLGHLTTQYRRRPPLLSIPITTARLPKIDFTPRRPYAASAAFVPKPYLFRLFWTFVTGTVGFIYYKISEASDWLSEQLNFVGLALGSSIAGILDPASVIEDIFDGWKTLSLLLPSPKNNPRPSQAAPVLAASPANEGASTGTEDESNGNGMDEFKHFIKRMIEIRNILRAAHLDQQFNLPSVVVIGSQSSGKSSVLESIVGHEFLPKGHNMVTRRPLELTLVNDPQSTSDYGIFAEDPESPVFDFGQIQRILTERNLAVPEADWISEEPIQLTIHSKHIPDLTLIDLPGYIQINNRLQPAVLREKIAGLCEKYIQGSSASKNIILAVCPADVDLANAEALKASRRVDPTGERTLGVITKLDLVDPEYGAQLLVNEDYPLSLGYIGVVCKPGAAAKPNRMLSFMQDPEDGGSAAVYEQRYFAKHREIFSRLADRTGINSLRNKLTVALEESLAGSMSGILKDVQEELAEVKYQLKVEFSDRNMTPEGYVNTLLTALKGSLEGLTKSFTRPHVKQQIEQVLAHHLVQVIERCYPDDETGDDAVLAERLQRSMAILTRSGIGKVASGQIVDALLKGLEARLQEGPLSLHPRLRERLMRELEHKLRLHSLVATEMVENALKPYKHEIEYSPSDWTQARKQVLELLKGECNSISAQLDAIQQEIGGKRLRKVIQFLAESPASQIHNKVLVERAQTVVALNHRLKILKRRLEHLEKTPECRQADIGEASFLSRFLPWSQRRNYEEEDGQLLITSSPCHKLCPEIYLYMVNERLLKTAALFVHHELIHEFMASLPHDLMASGSSTNIGGGNGNEVTKELVRGTVDREAARPFVSENVQVTKHVDLLERRRALERVRDRLLYLRHRKDEALLSSSYS